MLYAVILFVILLIDKLCLTCSYHKFCHMYSLYVHFFTFGTIIEDKHFNLKKIRGVFFFFFILYRPLGN